jgi:hypothetical protein
MFVHVGSQQFTTVNQGAVDALARKKPDFHYTEVKELMTGKE